MKMGKTVWKKKINIDELSVCIFSVVWHFALVLLGWHGGRFSPVITNAMIIIVIITSSRMEKKHWENYFPLFPLLLSFSQTRRSLLAFGRLASGKNVWTGLGLVVGSWCRLDVQNAEMTNASVERRINFSDCSLLNHYELQLLMLCLHSGRVM